MMSLKKQLAKLTASLSSRSLRIGGYSVAATALVLAIVIMVNLLVGALPARWTQFDTSAQGLFTLSQQTQVLTQGLEQDVTIYWVVRSGYEEPYIGTLLDQYAALSDHITLKQVDPDRDPTFAQAYTDSLEENSLIVESGDRFRYIPYSDIFLMDYDAYYLYGQQNWSFCAESEITSALDYLVRQDLPTVYLLTGHGEGSLPQDFASAVEKSNLQTQQLSLLTAEFVPDDADCLLIYGPQRDISLEEQEKIETYLANGGKVLVLCDPPQDGSLPHLQAILSHYGVTAGEGIVVEGDQDHYIWGTPYYLLPDIQSHSITDPLTTNGYSVLLPVAQGLTISETLPDNVTVTALLTTSDDAFSKAAGYSLSTYEKEEADVSGPFALAVAASETLDDGITSDLIWVGSTALLDQQTNEMVSGGNQDLFLNMLHYLCQSQDSGISIHPKSLSTEYLTMDSGTASLLITLWVGLVPAAYLTVGILIWYRRKRR